MYLIVDNKNLETAILPSNPQQQISKLSLPCKICFNVVDGVRTIYQKLHHFTSIDSVILTNAPLHVTILII